MESCLPERPLCLGAPQGPTLFQLYLQPHLCAWELSPETPQTSLGGRVGQEAAVIGFHPDPLLGSYPVSLGP